MNLENEIDDLYERWLLDVYGDRIRNKEELLEMFSEGFERDTFNDFVKEVI